MRTQMMVIKRGSETSGYKYEVQDFSRKVIATRRRLKHAREVADCLEMGNPFPSQRQQMLASLMRLKIKKREDHARPWCVMTYDDDYPVASFTQRWRADDYLMEYNELRRVKMHRKEPSEEDKLIDIVMNKWLVSDDSRKYGDLLEEAKRVLALETA